MLQIMEGNCKRIVLTGDSNSNIDWKNSGTEEHGKFMEP